LAARLTGGFFQPFGNDLLFPTTQGALADSECHLCRECRVVGTGCSIFPPMVQGSAANQLSYCIKGINNCPIFYYPTVAEAQKMCR
jgi:hypothetical protein